MVLITKGFKSFFRLAVQAAVKKEQNIILSEHAKMYVIQLLCDFTKSENLFFNTNKGQLICLTDMLESALLAQKAQSSNIFKRLGDTSLYLIGFFGTKYKNNLLPKSYYIDIGAKSYQSVSMLISRPDQAALFLELSECFLMLVRLIELVKDFSNNHSNHIN